ncbi:hypothetical protein P7K49_029195 [Saguinus oedipus]|uniref:Empty spiracles homeobox 1 n=1 Tax=Saguinus oedipus TaxID=9490 RepID=A0ABQ9U6H9_SAGOE|nr:hypothetical protein P7K49_029195 [Saguinus oedipus]
MFQPATKRGFTIESLVAKDGGTGGATGGGGAGSHLLAAAASEEPLRPTALNYPHPSAAEAAFVSGFPAAAAAGAGRSLYGGPELVFPEAMNHPALTVHPAHQLGASPLQPPHSFFGAQHRDPLHFYPWVLRNRFFGHRFQGGRPAPALRRCGGGSGARGAVQKLLLRRLRVRGGPIAASSTAACRGAGGLEAGEGGAAPKSCGLLGRTLGFEYSPGCPPHRNSRLGAPRAGAPPERSSSGSELLQPDEANKSSAKPSWKLPPVSEPLVLAVWLRFQTRKSRSPAALRSPSSRLGPSGAAFSREPARLGAAVLARGEAASPLTEAVEGVGAAREA